MQAQHKTMLTHPISMTPSAPYRKCTRRITCIPSPEGDCWDLRVIARVVGHFKMRMQGYGS